MNDVAREKIAAAPSVKPAASSKREPAGGGVGTPPLLPRQVDLAEEARKQAALAVQLTRDLHDVLPEGAVNVATIEVIRGVNRKSLVLWSAVAAALVISAIGFWTTVALSSGADRSELLHAFMPIITLLVGGGGGAAIAVRSR